MSGEREPFLSRWPLLAVAVFALNNFWLKGTYPGWVTGKLSDVCLCFFFPLYLAWMLSECGARSWSLARRLRWGASITVGALVVVKASDTGSQLLNAMVATITAGSPFHFANNHADATDLLALPMVWLALRFARSESTFTAVATGRP